MRNFRLPILLGAVVVTALSIAAAQSMPMGVFEGLATLKEGRSMRASSSDPDWRNGNGDARPIAPGATLVLAELEGPGVIQHFWNTIAAEELGYSRLLVLRMYWDGEVAPSVECPIGDFFAVGHGMDAPFWSAPVCVTSNGRARNCYWPMPFRKSARVTVTNEGSRMVHAFYYYLDWHKLPKLPADVGYLHAAYRQEHPAVMGRNYLIADIMGRGHYVGTVLSVRQHQPSWWGEGDDFFYIDGEEEPSIRGTGSEDYFCDAWGLRHIEGPFYGVPVFEGYEAFSRTTAYRWHIPDPVTFKKSLRVEIEHRGVGFDDKGEVISGFEEREDDFSSVAFWYQTEPHKAFPQLPAPYDRLYFDPRDVVEIEQWLPDAQATDGAVSLQQGLWSGQGQLFWTPGSADQQLTVPFDVGEAGSYELTLLFTHSFDYGTFRIALDGNPIGGTVDLYDKEIVTRNHGLGKVELTAGRHTLTFQNAGKNAESRGHFFGLDALFLTPE